MSVDVPASVPDLEKPQGSVTDMERFARVLFRTSARYEEVADRAYSLGWVPGWSGEASEKYLLKAKGSSSQYKRLASSLGRVGRACTGHADTLKDLLAERKGLVHAKAEHDQLRTQLIDDVRTVGDAETWVIDEFRRRAEDLARKYSHLRSDQEEWKRKVLSNELLVRGAFAQNDTLAEVLSPSPTVNWVARAVMDKPGAAGSGATPQEVEKWWSMLTGWEQEAVITAYPSVIGSADDLPAGARDQANRISLTDVLARLGAKHSDGTLSRLEEKTYANAQAAEKALNFADDYVDPTVPSEKPGGQLYMFDPAAFDGDGKIGIAVGNLDTAKDVVVRVPGITSDGLDAVDLTHDAANVYQSARYNGDGSSVASMMWLG